MQLNHLQVNNFRNYEQASLDFSKGINVFLGENAQGKTNLLESIYFLALTRSHRTANIHDLINWNADEAYVSGEFNRSSGKNRLELTINKKGRKAKVNHIEQAKLSTYIGQLNVILFAPEDLSIVKGSPSDRRKFMDIEFGQMSNRYLYNTTQYRKILKQRNNYLKQLQMKVATDRVYLEVLSDQLSAYAAEIMDQRINLLKKLQKWSGTTHAEISQKQEVLDFKYSTSLTDDQLTSVEMIYQSLLSKFKANQDKEIRQGSTMFGPHRDDLIFMVNQKNVQTFGSQGQQRTTALSTKLAEIELMKEETGEYPILLLDDVLSELDQSRKTHLLQAIQNKVQTFLTTPSMSNVASELINDPKEFQIKNGKIL